MELVTLSATAITTLAFKKFLETGAGELGKKFTETAITKMDELRNMIWEKLRGNSKAEKALTAVEQGSNQELDRLAVYVQDAMEDDQQFASEIKAIAQEIHAGKIQDNSSNIMNVNDKAKGIQNNIENIAKGVQNIDTIKGDHNYVAQEMHIHQGSD
ncbi:hypothetical protein [Moorena sp. SIO3H5]|uniref:hypothetical protein n=1 Tax=Moorena sp. SIO3H5 TaxID=2607834 RepID=UPI0013BCDCC7|nr:hypothetical protein [Moorena sp. SIO3H5]NEO70793.1 hypothetical protein [Moorena sp. SIO3H5]